MSVQVLISTMHRVDLDFLEVMNLNSDAIVINQADRFSYIKTKKRSKTIEMFTLNERGVGLSRNTALMRATADVVLIADDDICYVDGYEQLVAKAFEDRPDADMILFNFQSTNPDRPEYLIGKEGRVRWYNSLRYGAFRIALRTASFRKKNLTFSLEFGGGAPYMSGEDSLFIYNAIKRGLVAYAVPIGLGTVTHETSTWFHGYDEKFFLDKGALFAAISKSWGKIFVIYYVLRNYKSFNNFGTKLHLIKLVFKGIDDYEKR